MSNAPDRLDGFHDNLCCRGTADKGRSRENLRAYGRDRRAYEFWVEGDWPVADKLMRQVSTSEAVRTEPCLRGHPGPCSADHIGPISLGFTHRPEFQLLCTPCNAAKNYRMFATDVELLRGREADSETVASWYCKDLWDLRKNDVVDDSTAKRLSMQLRDNRHNAMMVLNAIRSEGYYTFLTTLLSLHNAECDVQLMGIEVREHLVRPAEVQRTRSSSEYVIERKAARVRVAFDALISYAEKEARNALTVTSPDIEKQVDEILRLLGDSPTPVQQLDADLRTSLSRELPLEGEIRANVGRIPIPEDEPENFGRARKLLREAMASVAQALSDKWEDKRYVRDLVETEEPLDLT